MNPRGRKIVKESPATAIRRKKYYRKIIIFFFCFITSIYLLSIASRADKLAISKVVLENATVVEEKDVKNVVDEVVDGSYLGIFSKRNVLIYPRKKIIRTLLEREKRIQTLFLNIENNTELHIRVIERGGTYLWCGETPDEANSSNCYFIDSEGYIFDDSPYFSDNVYFKFYGKRNTDGDIIGSYFSETNNFEQLVKFANTVRSFGLMPRGIYVNADGDNELILEKRGQTNAPGVLFAKDADLLKTANTLGSALSGEPLLSAMKDKYDKLEYLDVRFVNKVFYKFSE